MKLGVIGCGKMGTAWVAGMVRGGAAKPEEVVGLDAKPEAVEEFLRATGANAAASMADLAQCEVVLLCTKPQDVGPVLCELRECSHGREGGLLISIAAGVTLAALESLAGHGTRVVRVMPNTPALVAKGAAAYSLGTHATRDDALLVSGLLDTVGISLEIPEKWMDAVTGLSGSGPAYVYLMIEALADGGVRNGLPREHALKLAAQTVVGAAAMVMETGEHPARLKDMVTSPGGTTIEGLAVLEQRGFRSALIDAVTAATARSRMLGS